LKLQEYLFKKASHPIAVWIVGFLTLLDSIFLFVPPEIFMTPPIVANKKRAVPVVIAASIGSLVGGAITYAIGFWLYRSVGIWLIDHFASQAQFAAAQGLFNKYGLLIIIISAVTPVPYKLMALAAGFVGFNPILFLGVSSIFRTGRFAIFGYLLWRFQEQANRIVQKYFWPLTVAAIIAAILGIFLITLM